MLHSHVLGNRSIADGVCCCRDASLTAIAAATAVQAGHVHPVQVIMVLPSSGSPRVFLTILIRPVHTQTHIIRAVTNN